MPQPNMTRARVSRPLQVYSVRIEELRDDKWRPFKADDVQYVSSPVPGPNSTCHGLAMDETPRPG